MTRESILAEARRRYGDNFYLRDAFILRKEHEPDEGLCYPYPPKKDDEDV
jgi:hypothetical protein